MKKERKDSYFYNVFKRFLGHKLAMVGVIVLIVEIFCVIFLPEILKLDPYSLDVMSMGALLTIY